MTRPNSIRLNCERLEARDVPAIVIDGTAATPTLVAGSPPTPNGGLVSIQEVAFAATDTNVINQGFTAFEQTTRNAAANDNITLVLNGSTLTISSSDGIFIRFTANGGNTFFHNRGTTLDVPNVTGVNAILQLGGDDTVSDMTPFANTLAGGPGNDMITAEGAPINMGLLQLYQQPGGINPALYPAIFGVLGPGKTIVGDEGNDTLVAPLVGFFTQLVGGEGNDFLVGGIGLDILNGGGGSDVLFGRGGKDYYFAADSIADPIFSRVGDFVFADPFDPRFPG
jgi:Ca2+-binding RTX toxin-like protein